jgi:hypothetical protein
VTDTPLPSNKLLLEAARDLVTALAELSISPTFIGGMAASLLAKPRHTKDLDALILFDTADAKILLDTLTRHRFRPRFDKMVELARRARMVTVLHEPTGSVVDIALGCMPFESEVQERSTQINLAGFDIRLPSPEDLVILKAIANRPKDLEDIRNMARVYPGMDRDRIRFWVEQYAELLENPDLWSEIESLLGGA